MTELEACVLALICHDGPITAYQVRMEFERSRASSWRASTGSIYPLIKRMSAQGLVEMRPEPDDKRGAKKLVATAAGRRRAKAWLTEAPSWIGDVTEDPIRTRVHFLGLLPGPQRAEAIERMIAVTRASLAELDQGLREFDSTTQEEVERLVYQGARAALAARAAWLVKAKAFFAARD